MFLETTTSTWKYTPTLGLKLTFKETQIDGAAAAAPDKNTPNSEENVINASSTNYTCALEGSQGNQGLISQIFTQVVMALIMFGLGCTSDIKIIWSYIKQPQQLVVGLGLQLIVFPFLGLGLTKVFSFTQAQSLGVLITCSCPGGTISNLATYWLDGEMNLSIVLTTLSTFFALGTMPLWLYTLPLIIGIKDECLKIPFQELGYALAGIVLPAFIGVLLKYNFPKPAKVLCKICTILGSLGTCAFLIFFFASLAQGMFNNTQWNVVGAAILMPAVAGVLSYLVTRLPWMTFSVPARRTVTIETLVQNSAVALAVTFLSFDFRNRFLGQILLFPIYYGWIQLIAVIIAVLFYIISKCLGCCIMLHPEETKDTEKKPTHKEGDAKKLLPEKPSIKVFASIP